MNKQKLNVITVVSFKRKDNSEWEIGLLLNEGNLGILDQEGKFINECWDYRNMNALTVDLGAIFRGLDY